MFTTALFEISKNWKQSRCPSIAEWINRLWYNHEMEYYSVIERDEGLPGGAVVKNPPANPGDTGSSPGPGRSHMLWSN